MTPPPPLSRRITDLLEPCLEWEGARNTAGYGHQKIKGKFLDVHRVVWANANGPIPEGMLIMHLCDNPPCYRLSHLRLGTTQDNVDDKVSKGRTYRGAAHHSAKLTEDRVLAIREDTRTGAVVAQEYGVSTSLIHQVRRRAIWKHLP